MYTFIVFSICVVWVIKSDSSSAGLSQMDRLFSPFPSSMQKWLIQWLCAELNLPVTKSIKNSTDYPSVFLHLSRVWYLWQKAKQGIPDVLLPKKGFLNSSWEIPSAGEQYIPPASPWSTLGSLPNWSCLENLQMEEVILTRCQSHLSWLLSMQRSSSFIPSSCQSELFTPSLRLNPTIQWRKLISAACISFFWWLSKAHDWR